MTTDLDDLDIFCKLPVTTAVLISVLKPSGGFRGGPGQYRCALAAALTHDALIHKHVVLEGVYDAVVQPGPGSEHSDVIQQFFPINPGQKLEHTVGGLCPGAGNVSEVVRALNLLLGVLRDSGHVSAQRNNFTGLTKYRVEHTKRTVDIRQQVTTALITPDDAPQWARAAMFSLAAAGLLKTLPVEWTAQERKARSQQILRTDPVAHAVRKTIVSTSLYAAVMVAAFGAPLG